MVIVQSPALARLAALEAQLDAMRKEAAEVLQAGPPSMYKRTISRPSAVTAMFLETKEMLGRGRPTAGAPPRRPEPPKGPRAYEEIREAARHYGGPKKAEAPTKPRPRKK